MDHTEILFVYGTLRKDYDHSWAKVLRTNAKKIDAAIFQGKLYDTGSFPAVIPSDNEEDQVTGDLYLISNPSFVFAKLDSYEDYDPKYPAKSLFIRKKVAIKRSEGTERKAWIYIYNRSVDNLTLIPDGDYIKYIS